MHILVGNIFLSTQIPLQYHIKTTRNQFFSPGKCSCNISYVIYLYDLLVSILVIFWEIALGLVNLTGLHSSQHSSRYHPTMIHYLNQWWPSSMTPNGVPRLQGYNKLNQWLNLSRIAYFKSLHYGVTKCCPKTYQSDLSDNNHGIFLITVPAYWK